MLSTSNNMIHNVNNMVHEETQKHKNSIDLTLSKVYTFKNKGNLDFGGSEWKESSVEEIQPEKQSAKDKYGWWVLEEGMYKVEFNEELINGPAMILSIPRLLQTGCFLPMQMRSEGKIKSVLLVGKHGVAIKENARIAGLFQLK